MAASPRADAAIDDAAASQWLLLSRPGCHLCDEFCDELVTAFPQLAASLKWVDVDSRDDWRQAYGLKIPVLLADAQLVCETEFDRESVAAALKRIGVPAS